MDFFGQELCDQKIVVFMLCWSALFLQQVVEDCTAVAGMSVGEFTALMFAGAMSLEAGGLFVLM